MLKIFRIPQLILFFVSSLAIISATTAEPSAESALKTQLQNLQSMQSNFTQAVKDEKGKDIQRSQGKFWLQKPGQFRWQTQKPFKQDIVTQENDLWIYDVDLEQIVVQPIDKAAGKTPALLLTGNASSLLTHYSIEQKGEEFTLKPKDDEALFVWLKMRFSGEALKTMELADNLGQRSLITFTQSKINKPIANNLFILNPPKGVDVIRN